MADFYTTQELAGMLGVSHSTAKRMCLTGAVKAVKVGRMYQIPKTSVARCRVCGKWFAVCKSHRIYCSDDCRHEGVRKASLDYWHKTHPPKDPEPIAAEECEQMCFDLPFEPEPPKFVMPDYMEAFAAMFERLAKSFAETAERLRK